MATFKVGQRVKVIGPGHGYYVRKGWPNPIGHTGTVVCVPADSERNADCCVELDNYPPDPDYGSYGAMFYQLAPLTDPKESADTWAADKVREVVKPMHVEPVAPPKVTA